MTIIDPYYLSIDAEPMATFAKGLEVVDGLETVPSRARTLQKVAYVDGANPMSSPAFFHPKQQKVRIWIAPFDADGNVTHANGPRAHLRENLENLYALIAGKSIPNHNIQWIVPTPTATKTLENTAEITAPIQPAGSSRLVRRLEITLDYTWPFWRDITTGETTLGPFSGSQSFTPGGTAPLADAVFTCTSAGRITHDETGDFIEVTSIPSGSVIIDQRPPKSVTSGGADARDVYNSNRPWGLRFSARTLANLTITGQWQIDYYNAEH